jgi:hypothetical protein
MSCTAYKDFAPSVSLRGPHLIALRRKHETKPVSDSKGICKPGEDLMKGYRVSVERVAF